MKLIKPSFEILEQGFSIDDIYKHIELCGRTCYKSADKITENSAIPFVNRMINSKHYAILEHGTVYLTIPNKNISRSLMIYKYEINPYSKVVCTDDNIYITTNYRVIIENNWIEHLKYITSPTKFHEKRITVKFICNRQVSHEFVRHRVFSFAQESTRYCNYTKDKFDGELTFIQPCWNCIKTAIYNGVDKFDGDYFEHSLIDAEFYYFKLIELGWKPQQAATVLPNALKTELIMTGFVDETGWKHFFDLRAKGTTGAPHPQAKELAESLMKEFIKRKYINYDTERMV